MVRDWRGGFLDEHRPPGAVRVRVLAIVNCLQLRDLYYVRRPSLARAVGHLREVGPLWLGRKIMSRLSESNRNEKFLSIGIGEIVEADGASSALDGVVVFIAPCHPRAAERIVLPMELVARWQGAVPPGVDARSLVRVEARAAATAELRALAGWSPYSGVALRAADVESALKSAQAMLASISWERAAERYPTEPAEPLRECSGEGAGTGRPTAALFGFGHYARTIVWSGVRSSLDVVAVHEVDPALIPPKRNPRIQWSTNPELSTSARHDAYLIASFHHTHAPLAVQALARGAAAVVEKPLATDRAQLGTLLAALKHGRGRFFAGFHKRYSPLNDLALRDCPVPEPIHYHCIVFEEPLPARHWYRWPNSRTRIVSNGCHWLDHFLYLNDWSPPTDIQVARSTAGRESANVSVRLENGAFFSMVLSDAGSSRIGVRDYIELRCAGVTVRIENGSKYTSENGARVIRRASVNKMESYERMYREIASRIAARDAGDTLHSIEASSSLVLRVEEEMLTIRS